ncbi:putative saccharopine dehydrogenase [Hyaloraphidium curvatum]|nr:putative saccharopine dehydrogenase [Hyaloraphidium curvatum]
MARPYDVVVLGATGFTGCYVAEYLAERYAPEIASGTLKVGLAGRSEEKLRAVVKDCLAVANGKLNESHFGIIKYDAGDQTSVDGVVGSTRVAIACAGPYARLGTAVVKACVEKRTHYCDITGEAHWVKSMMDQFGEKAAADGTFIISFCGFDSIPSDTMAFVLADFVKKQYGEETKSIKVTISKNKGGVSGGTLASVREMLDGGSGKALDSRNLYALNPPNLQSGPDKPRFPFYYDKDFRSFQGFWIMEGVNGLVVRRTQALLRYPFGNFSYSETLSYKSRLSLIASTAALVTFGIFLFLRPTRWFLYRFILPAPGQGTVSKEERRTNFIELKGIAESVSGKHAFARFYGPGDPGYAETAKYVAEAGLCLALQKDQLPGKGGVITPIAAFGQVLVDRLRKAGTIIEVGDKEI